MSNRQSENFALYPHIFEMSIERNTQGPIWHIVPGDYVGEGKRDWFPLSELSGCAVGQAEVRISSWGRLDHIPVQQVSAGDQAE